MDLLVLKNHDHCSSMRGGTYEMTFHGCGSTISTDLHPSTPLSALDVGPEILAHKALQTLTTISPVFHWVILCMVIMGLGQQSGINVIAQCSQSCFSLPPLSFDRPTRMLLISAVDTTMCSGTRSSWEPIY